MERLRNDSMQRLNRSLSAGETAAGGTPDPITVEAAVEHAKT